MSGDFNAGKLKSVLPNFHQHVKCATRRKKSYRSPRGVRGRPYKLSKTPATPVINYSLYYHMASGTGVPSLGQKGFSTVFTPKA